MILVAFLIRVGARFVMQELDRQHGPRESYTLAGPAPGQRHDTAVGGEEEQ